MKQLHIFLSDSDMCRLLEFILSLGSASIYTTHAEPVKSISDIDNNNLFFCIIPKDWELLLNTQEGQIFVDLNTPCLRLEAPFASSKDLTVSGSLCIVGNDSPPLRSMYNTICHHIKANYIRSTDKYYYISPNLYRQWREGLVSFGFALLHYQAYNIKLENFSMDEFLVFLKQQGYHIYVNGHDIREDQNVNMYLADSYVIFSANAFLKTKIAARKKYFLPDSECVFLYKKKHHYQFVIDVRLLQETNKRNTIMQMFCNIKAHYGENLQPVLE